MAPTIESALVSLQSRLAACGRAARHGDLEGLSETRSEAAKLYAQVERALGVFEGALSPAPSDAPFAPVAVPAVAPAAAAAGFAPRLASAPPLELRGSSPTGDARPGGAQLPDGWGERQSAVSADELMRRGIILPDEPLGDLK